MEEVLGEVFGELLGGAFATLAFFRCAGPKRAAPFAALRKHVNTRWLAANSAVPRCETRI